MGTAEMDALDDTRIHPSFYDTAKCLAQVALGSANPDPRNGDPLAVDKILSRPQDIEALDLLVRHLAVSLQFCLRSVDQLRNSTLQELCACL